MFNMLNFQWTDINVNHNEQDKIKYANMLTFEMCTLQLEGQISQIFGIIHGVFMQMFVI